MLAISVLYRDIIFLIVMLLSALAFVLSLTRAPKSKGVVFLSGFLFVLASTFPMLQTSLLLWGSSSGWPALAWLSGYLLISLAALTSASQLMRGPTPHPSSLLDGN